MTRLLWSRVGLVGVAMALGLGCEARPTPRAEPAPAAPAPRRDGVVRFADVQEPVVPFVMHDPSLDLVVQCRLKRDAELAAGHDAPLCYAEERRPRDAVKVLRVDVLDGGPQGRRAAASVLPALARVGDGLHFLVERSGTPYQLLDLAHAARRDGALRPDEVRVLCVTPGDWRPLVADLARLFPQARQEVVSHVLPVAPLPPAAATPAAPTPALPTPEGVAP